MRVEGVKASSCFLGLLGKCVSSPENSPGKFSANWKGLLGAEAEATASGHGHLSPSTRSQGSPP